MADVVADAYASSLVETLAAQALEQAEAWTYLVGMRIAVLENEHREQLPMLVEIEKEAPTLAPLSNEHDQTLNVLQAIHESGHRLRIQGRFMVCQGCRLRTAVGNVRKWLDKKCPALHWQDTQIVAEISTASEDVPPQSAVSESTKIWVSRAKARQMRTHRLMTKRNHIRAGKTIKKQAEKRAAQLACSDFVSRLATMSKKDLPFEVHQTHWRVIELCW